MPCFFQRAQSGKGKAAEKSPQDEKAPTAMGGAAVELNGKIVDQGNRVRQLKTEKAAKVGVTAVHR